MPRDREEVLVQRQWQVSAGTGLANEDMQSLQTQFPLTSFKLYEDRDLV